MAREFYCDQWAYTLNLGVTPTLAQWAQPQEGDGTSVNPATSSSVASITLNSNPTATPASTIKIASVTFTAVASGAAANSANFNVVSTGNTAADLNSNADAIANCINACNTPVLTTVAVGQPMLKNLVYARGPTIRGDGIARVDIMMRIGSATLNTINNSALAFTQANWATAPSFVDFSGGSGGCLGWFLNDVALGVSSSLAKGNYGAFLYIPYVLADMNTPTVPITDPTTFTIKDNLYVRTGTAVGADKLIDMGNVGSSTYSKQANWNIAHIFDTNTKFSGTGTNKLTLSFDMSTYQSVTRIVMMSSGGKAIYKCLRRNNFEFKARSLNASKMQLVVTVGPSQAYLDGILYTDQGTQYYEGIYPFQTAGDGSYSYVHGVRLDYVKTGATTQTSSILGFGDYNQIVGYRFDECNFTWTVSGTSNTGYIFDTGTYTSFMKAEFYGCTFNGFASGYSLWGSPTWQGSNINVDLRMEQCKGIKIAGSTFNNIATTAISNIFQDIHRVYITLNDTFQTTRYETVRGCADWIPADNPPTFSATLADGITPYSMRIYWLANNALDYGRTYKVPELVTLNRFSTATRQITLEMLVPNTFVFDHTVMELIVNYMDDTGTARVNNSVTVVDSTAAWANVPSGFIPKKISFTSTRPVALNSRIVSTLVLRDNPPGGTGNQFIYINPEITLT